MANKNYSAVACKPTMSKSKHERMESPKQKMAEAKRGGKS